MAYLIAAVGLSGSGKTTFIDYLESSGAGSKVYLGQAVHDAIQIKGLPANPENEKKLRFELRAEHGNGALALLALPTIKSMLAEGKNVLVDAVFAPEEYAILKDCSAECVTRLVAIRAPFDVRVRRLHSRAVRPLTEQELRDRDSAELQRLNLETALQSASYTIQNDGDRTTFEARINTFWADITRKTI